MRLLRRPFEGCRRRRMAEGCRRRWDVGRVRCDAEPCARDHLDCGRHNGRGAATRPFDFWFTRAGPTSFAVRSTSLCCCFAPTAIRIRTTARCRGIPGRARAGLQIRRGETHQPPPRDAGSAPLATELLRARHPPRPRAQRYPPVHSGQSNELARRSGEPRRGLGAGVVGRGER